MTGEMIERLKGLATRKTWNDEMTDSEDLCVYDFAGGNIDDAYFAGIDSGKTELARAVLDCIGVSW